MQFRAIVSFTYLDAHILLFRGKHICFINEFRYSMGYSPITIRYVCIQNKQKNGGR